MERKIGEIFEYNGEWYQCVEGTGCYQCAFNQDAVTCLADNPHCTSRSDRKDVVFKKLEKVGEPYSIYCPPTNTIILLQRYRTYEIPIFNDTNTIYYTTEGILFIDIEIKQTKEDMEETKLNIKPFSLEAAKAGKPVCTRDGRKARIICFDAKGDKPIIALIEMGVAETPNNYPIDGKAVSIKENSCDLMMLPEKHEGWAVIFKDDLLQTEKEAKELAGNSISEVIRIEKIEWEE